MRQRPDTARAVSWGRPFVCEASKTLDNSKELGGGGLIIFNSLTLQSNELSGDFYTLLWLTSPGYNKPPNRMSPLFSCISYSTAQSLTPVLSCDGTENRPCKHLEFLRLQHVEDLMLCVKGKQRSECVLQKCLQSKWKRCSRNGFLSE